VSFLGQSTKIEQLPVKQNTGRENNALAHCEFAAWAPASSTSSITEQFVLSADNNLSTHDTILPPRENCGSPTGGRL